MVEEEYLTKNEAMRYLRMSKTLFEQLMKLGLPHIRIKRKLIFKKSSIDAFMESLESKLLIADESVDRKKPPTPKKRE